MQTTRTSTLLVAVALLLATLASVALADSDNRITPEELLEITQGECIAQCDTVYKSEEVCERFCSFVKLFTGPALTEYHKRYIQYNGPRSAVSWAMTDTIEWRKKTNEEDENKIGNEFWNDFRKWSAFVYHQSSVRHEDL